MSEGLPSKKRVHFFQHSIFFWNLIFFFQKFFFCQNIIYPQQSSIIIFSLNIILQTHIFKVSTARLFRLGSVNARVGLISFSDKCYFLFLFLLLKYRVDLKKKSQTNTFVSILFLFWFFETGNIWTVNREYLGLSKGKKIIRQKKKKDFKFFFAPTESKLFIRWFFLHVGCFER